jgi:type IV secretion system protein VirD4
MPLRLPIWARLSLTGAIVLAAFDLVASALYLISTGLWGAYDNPWPLAFPEYLIYARDNPDVWYWLKASAIAATLLLLLAGIVIVRKLPTRTRAMLFSQRPGQPRPVERGRSDNHGHSQWRSLEDTKKRFPGPHPLWGGLVVGEAYRVDLDHRVRGVPFNPDDKATWGLGGRAPLLIDPCTHGGHSAVFAGTGSGKSATAKTQILHWKGSNVVFDPSIELGPELDGGAPGEAGAIQPVQVRPG